MEKITDDQAAIYHDIMNRVAKSMEGFKWSIVGMVDKPYSTDFEKQDCETGCFEYEYVAQYGDGDYGHHGTVLFPIGNKFICVEFYE